MVGVDEINTVNPSWRIERKKENGAQDGKNKKAEKKQPRSKQNQNPDDGRPHIDEYA